MKKIYFLCTGNSCRSQMAEGFAKKYFSEDWEIRSAGIETHGVNPLAIKVMEEAGIDISENHSDLINNDYLNSCDMVVTLCGDAKDKCPMTPANVKRIHWPLNDPAQAVGDEKEIIETFRNIRDEIERLVNNLSLELDDNQK
ncbi:arsenate reductase (thioredoxin) [Fructilactobacillus frigidiflavus]|uniref:arsenate reductase (thioredoxin) n=1 Tax=Fructilactobacillus frigidiflavus TaxID=3242688 RepID=UPI0037581474